MNHPPRNIVIDWLNTIWQTSLPSNAKLVACNLRRYMNSQNEMAWPSIARIAGECGLAEQSVRKHLKLLRDEGWLVARGESNLRTNIYQASYPATIAPSNDCTLQITAADPATIAPELNKELNNINTSNSGKVKARPQSTRKRTLEQDLSDTSWAESK